MAALLIWLPGAAVQAAEGAAAEAEALFAKAAKVLEEKPGDAEGLRMLEEAAGRGHAGAANRLGHILENGLGVPRDAGAAKGWFERAAAAGLPRAKFNLARSLLNEKSDTGRAVRLLEEAAREGVTPAALTLGRICLDGAFGQKADKVAALGWFKLAAEAGDAEAQNTCGALLLYGGPEIKPDKKASTEWFRRAALQGHAKAQASYGEALLWGYGGRRDRIEALKFFMLSSDQGEITGQRAYEDALPSYSDEEIEKARRAADEFKLKPERGGGGGGA